MGLKDKEIEGTGQKMTWSEESGNDRTKKWQGGKVIVCWARNRRQQRKATYIGGSEEPLALSAKLNGYPREQDSPSRGDDGRRGRGRVAAACSDIVG
jgi:hypothetical protein